MRFTPASIFLYAALLALSLPTGAETAAPAPAPTPAAGDTAASEDRDSAPQACVHLSRIKSTRVLDNKTILFNMNGGIKLVNRLPHTCNGLKFEKRFGYRTSLHQLCNVDTIFVVTDHGSGAHCGLGMFEPYVEPEVVTPPSAAGELKS